MTFYQAAKCFNCLLYVFVCLLSVSPAYASGSEAEVWQVISVTGEGTVKSANVAAKAVKPNDRVHPGDQLDAGLSSQVVLARGETSIAMTSGSQLVVPEKTESAERATIMQKLGTLLFKVEQEGNGACHTGEYSCFFRDFGA